MSPPRDRLVSTLVTFSRLRDRYLADTRMGGSGAAPALGPPVEAYLPAAEELLQRYVTDDASPVSIPLTFI